MTFLIPPDLILVTTLVGAAEDANLNGNEAWFRDRMVSWELGDKDETNIVNILLPGFELMSKTDHRSNAVEDYTLQFLTQI